MAFKITSNLDDLNRRIGLIITNTRNSVNQVIPELAKSTKLPKILGECYQRGIDNSQDKLEDISDDYKAYKFKRFKSKKILFNLGDLYKRAVLPGFFLIGLSSTQSIKVSFSDETAKAQAKAGRNPLIEDDQLRKDLNGLTKEILKEKLSTNLNLK